MLSVTVGLCYTATFICTVSLSVGVFGFVSASLATNSTLQVPKTTLLSLRAYSSDVSCTVLFRCSLSQ